MGQADSPLYRVHKKQRYTVCKKGRQHNARLIGNNPVYIPVILIQYNPLSLISIAHTSDIGRMGLVRTYKIRHIPSQYRPDTPEIFIHILFSITSCITQIHTAQKPFAHTAQTGAEQMSDNPCLFQ